MGERNPRSPSSGNTRFAGLHNSHSPGIPENRCISLHTKLVHTTSGLGCVCGYVPAAKERTRNIEDGQDQNFV